MQLLNRNEVCRFFGGINPATLYRHIRQGRLPKPVKVGGRTQSLNLWLLPDMTLFFGTMASETATLPLEVMAISKTMSFLVTISRTGSL
jgi:hypothetical protein